MTDFQANYSCGELLAVVRKQDYKDQYNESYAFYDEIIKFPQFDDNKPCLKFDEIYESINPDWLDEEKDKIEQCVEVMMIALRDIEMKEPKTFLSIIKVLVPFLKN